MGVGLGYVWRGELRPGTLKPREWTSWPRVSVRMKREEIGKEGKGSEASAHWMGT